MIIRQQIEIKDMSIHKSIGKIEGDKNRAH